MLQTKAVQSMIYAVHIFIDPLNCAEVFRIIVFMHEFSLLVSLVAFSPGLGGRGKWKLNYCLKYHSVTCYHCGFLHVVEPKAILSFLWYHVRSH